MGTLSQVCLNSLQNFNLLGVKKQNSRALSLTVFRPSQHPFKIGSGFSRQVKCIKTGSNFGPRNQFLEPLAALATDTDLEVTVRSASMVVPLEKTERRSLFLSNIDQSVNIYMGGIIFFAGNPNFPPEVMTKKLEAAYKKLLVHYDYLAGRLRWNSQQGRLEIDCNSAGAGFVTASSKLSLAEVGDLVCPSPAFEQFVTRKWDNLWPKDQPLFILQVTSFKCGGISMGIIFNHTTLDGIGLQIFLQHLASLASNNPDLPFPPCNNRHLLEARSPPHVTQSHLELVDLGQNTSRGYDTSTPSLFISKSDNLQRQVLRLSAEDIINLKKKATVLGNNANAHKFSSGIITSFNVVTSHIWRCMTLARYDGEDGEKTSVILFPINIRARLRPRLPASYIGNAVISGYGLATYGEVEENPFSNLVERIAEGARRVKDEYVRSVIDWRELHNGYVHGDILLSSWWRLGFNTLEFPWGKPRSSCPTVHQWSNIVILLQDIREVRNKGVNVFVSLPRNELDKFHALFYKFLSS